jgi:hypothetical protein
VASLERAFLALTLVGLVFGCWGIAWARTSRRRGKVLFGRLLFLAAILVLGGSAGAAALHRAEGLVPLGLVSGFLIMVMLWEVPQPAWPE